MQFDAPTGLIAVPPLDGFGDDGRDLRPILRYEVLSRPDDPVADLRAKVDNWIIRAAQHLVSQYGTEITAIITETIERWDGDEASRRIELHVGRDLQFIRINGTVVGSLAGLIIYSIAQLLF